MFVIPLLIPENINTSPQQCEQMRRIEKNNNPDLRRIINEVQKYTVSGTLKISDTTTCDTLVKKIIALTLSGHVLKVRKYVIENEDTFNGDYIMLLRRIFDYIDRSKLRDTQKGMALVAVAEAMYRSAFVVDQEINFYSCMIQLSEIKN